MYCVFIVYSPGYADYVKNMITGAAQMDGGIHVEATTSSSSPTLTFPCSMRPVTTVPRPAIEKTSSMGIKKGLSKSRVGSGMFSSTAAMSSNTRSRPNYRPQFFFRTCDITGNIMLQSGTEMVMPGDNATLDCELIAPVAIEAGLRFNMREGGCRALPS